MKSNEQRKLGDPIRIEDVGAYSFDMKTNKVTIGYDQIPRLIPNIDDVIGTNLDEGMEDFEDKYGGEKLESLLDFIKRQCKPGTDLKEHIQADFVTNRSTVLALITLKLRKIIAVREKGVIFLYNVTDDKFGVNNVKRYARANKFKWITSLGNRPHPNDNLIPAKVVFRATLKAGWRLYYSARIDGIDDNGGYVEKKLSYMSVNAHKKSLKKTLDTFQNCLSTTKTILRGIYDTNYVLCEIERENVEISTIFPRLRVIENNLMMIRRRLHHDGMAFNIYCEPDYSFKFEQLDESDLVPQDFLDHFL
ncbi:unnamed protein product [Caenorhabditis bovis]|uniref:Decapping nuclease n=1 Tax=Caenorhabditis bovis TaxID=2654633 RepID=A0A8S1EXR4_9PELO|nr:unnamed protein product [Caenorhabditis bovis]